MQMLMTRKQKTTTDANISDTTEKTKQEMTLDCLIGGVISFMSFTLD